MGIQLLRVTQQLSTSPSYFLPRKCLPVNSFLLSLRAKILTRSSQGGGEQWAEWGTFRQSPLKAELG